MKPPRQIEELEVVGYAEVLTKALLPAIVPPVFAFRSDRSVILVPPYRINDGELWNATSVSLAEAKALVDALEITLFRDPLPAVIGYEMFVDQNFGVHYEPRHRVEDQLATIFQQNIAQAERALAQGDLQDAEYHANVALAADDRVVTSIVIKAAIRRRRGDAGGERLMAKLVAGKLNGADFQHLVDRYSAVGALREFPVAGRSGSMSGVAALRAKAA